MMPFIFHLTSAAAWNAAKENGSYEAASLAEQGFIHCSLEHQVAGVLERYFAGQTGLVKLTIAPQKLASPLRYEWSTLEQDNFPHIYGPLNISAIVEVMPI